jgi:hypothetical protein
LEFCPVANGCLQDVLQECSVVEDEGGMAMLD